VALETSVPLDGAERLGGIRSKNRGGRDKRGDAQGSAHRRS
jgi:hypothetical protein